MVVFFFKQKTAYEMRISDWSSDVCSSDLAEMIVGVELRDRLRKSRRHGDAARIRLLGLFRVVIGRVLVADRAREHHDVRGFDREGYLRQGADRKSVV